MSTDQEIRAGNVEADPASVYERIKSKHLLFSESVEEREIRVDSEHAALLKGKLTGHQFEPLFERSIADLEVDWAWKDAQGAFLILPAVRRDRSCRRTNESGPRKLS